MPSTSVKVRSVSPRTLFATAKAMAASAAANHNTASSALPRRPSVLIIVLHRIFSHVHRDRQWEQLQPRRIGLQRGHLNLDCIGKQRLAPVLEPKRRQLGIGEKLAIAEAAVGEFVREHKRAWSNLDG